MKCNLRLPCFVFLLFNDCISTGLEHSNNIIITVIHSVQVLFLLLMSILVHFDRVVVSVSTSRSRDGLETYQHLVSVSSRKANVSVSAINVSCPRPIFRQILQVTIVKLIKSVVAVNKSVAELV